MIKTPSDFMPRQFDIADSYRNNFDLKTVETEACTLDDDDTLKYMFNMVFGRRLKKRQLSEKEILGDKFIELEKSKVILSDIINNPGERLHNVAQMDVQSYTELGDRGAAVKVLLAVADQALGFATDCDILTKKDNPNIMSPVSYVVQQWFTTDRPYQLPQSVLYESASVHKIGVGGWRLATFPIVGNGLSGSLLGNVYEGEKPFISLPSFNISPDNSEV